VGPPGAKEAIDEPRADEASRDEVGGDVDDDDRFRAERPPHHDQER
jgi:hypothetical protein